MPSLQDLLKFYSSTSILFLKNLAGLQQNYPTNPFYSMYPNSKPIAAEIPFLKTNPKSTASRKAMRVLGPQQVQLSVSTATAGSESQTNTVSLLKNDSRTQSQSPIQNILICYSPPSIIINPIGLLKFISKIKGPL